MIKIRHESGLIQNTITSTYTASKRRFMDTSELFFIQKYEHKLIQEQIPVEGNPLCTQLYDAQLHHATA
jgi:hypothetical protein